MVAVITMQSASAGGSERFDDTTMLLLKAFPNLIAG
jgi:hypothetical protein